MLNQWMHQEHPPTNYIDYLRTYQEFARGLPPDQQFSLFSRPNPLVLNEKKKIYTDLNSTAIPYSPPNSPNTLFPIYSPLPPEQFNINPYQPRPFLHINLYHQRFSSLNLHLPPGFSPKEDALN